MMIASMIDPLQAEKEFYEKPLFLSYSAISKMLYSPKLYADWYIYGNREEIISPSLIEGRVIHLLLLDNGNFDKQFVVCPDKIPTDTTKLVLDRVFNQAIEKSCDDVELKSLDTWILEELKLVNLHQSLKTDQQRLDKMLTEANTGYYSYLLSKGTRTVIDQQTLDKCKLYESVIKSDVKISGMLGLDTFMAVDQLVTNEKLLQCDLPNYAFGLKGIPDSVVINEKAKTVDINDLKTTSKTIADFTESIEYYRYDLQAAIQQILVWNNYKQYREYKWTFRFIVIDKYQQVYPFEVSEATMLKWLENLETVLKDAEYHYKSKRWGLPRKFDQGAVIL